MSINLLERRSLTAAVDKTAQKAPKMFLEKAFFGTVENHLSRNIDWEKVEKTDRLAVYVNPEEQSRLVDGGSSEVRSIIVPGTNEHKFFTAEKLALGKHLTSSVYGTTAADITAYRNAKIQDAVVDLVDRIRRRREWACAQALTTGKIEYQGDSLHFVIDFGFTSDQKLKLTGANKWDDASADILAQGRQRRRDISKRTGSGASICILGSDAAELFINNEKVMKKLDNQNYRIGSLDLTKDTVEGATLLGTIGSITYYEYAQSYTDRNGQIAELFPTNLALYGAPSRHFRRHRGIIAWEEEGLQSAKEFYSRVITKRDPDGRKIQVASCEIPAIHDPEAIVAVTVV